MVDAYLDLTLDDAIRLALQHSTVLRDVGGRLIQAPSLTATIYDPAIQATDPRFGVEGALSEFDAQFTTSAFFEKNDRALNNRLLGGGVNLFRQDLARIQSELSKKSATGTEVAVRHNVIDDANNASQNLFPRAFDWNLETGTATSVIAGWRHVVQPNFGSRRITGRRERRNDRPGQQPHQRGRVSPLTA